jgi:uncharacterized repeat protein (TIGR01451 family)
VKHQVDPLWCRGKSILIWLVSILLIVYGGMDAHVIWAQNPTLQSKIYYVAPTGSDSGPGTFEQPWQTIQKAANTMISGDTVYIRAGTYHEQVVPLNSGSPGDYITYAAYPGEIPSLDGSGVALPDNLVGLFDVSDRSYIHVTGLRVANNGAILVKRSSYIIIEKSRTYNTISSGIGVWGSQNITIDSNRVERANTSYWQECLTIASTTSFQVSNNEILNCGDQGIDVKQGSSDGQVFGNYVHHTTSTGIYLDAYDMHTYDIEVYQNLIHDISGDNGIALASEKGGLLENVYIYNNIVYHNRYCGVLLSKAGSGNSLGQHPLKNIRIINNTIYNNGWTGYGGGILVDNPDAQDTIIRNNLVSQNLSFQIVVDTQVQSQDVTIDHNLIHGYRGYDGETYGSAYVIGDPLFINPAAADFHLQAGSPAIDAGSVDGAPENDFAGEPRPQGSGYDIGAYEFPAYNKMATPRVASMNEIITYTITLTGNGNTVTITDTLPSQLDYQTSTLTCPGTVSYNSATRQVQYTGTPPNESVCDIQISVRVNTNQRMVVRNSATIDDGQPPLKSVSSTVILNGLYLHMPVLFK